MERDGASLTIATVFPHPGDETTLAPALARFVTEGHTVHVIATTDGGFGTAAHTDYAAGRALVAVRRRELACACRALGAEPPIELGGADMMGMDEGLGAVFGEIDRTKRLLVAALDSLRPDVVITFGPDGAGGHTDHRLTGLLVSELVLARALARAPTLYQFAYSPAQAAHFEGWGYSSLDTAFLETRVAYEASDVERYLESLRCHESQFSAAQVADLERLEAGSPDRGVWLRRVVGEVRL